MNCTSCGKKIDTSAGIPQFCPWCGVKLENEQSDLAVMLEEALAVEDTAARHEKLLAVRERYPDRPEVERQLLYLGRLYERGGKPDFYRIPFWPLNALEKPREFSARERKKMLETFFLNPEIGRVGAMTEDPQAFRREYFNYMAEQYVDMFLKHSNSNTTFLGFRRKPADVAARCENELITMLCNLDSSPDVPDTDKPEMRSALIRGFGAVFGPEAEEHLERCI